MSEDARLEAIFSNTRWRAEMAALRTILRGAGLTETFKWRGPCYTHAGGNVAFLIALKDGVSLGFFKGVLLTDPAGVLSLPGENSRVARVFRAASVEAITVAESALRAILAEAMRLEEAGAKVDLPKAQVVLPDDLAPILADDPELARAFAALTPGRQRGWALHFAQAKQAATRLARLEKARPQILAGRGMNDR